MKFDKKFMRNCGWTNGFIARYNLIVEIPRQTQTKQGEKKWKEMAVCLPMNSRQKSS